MKICKFVKKYDYILFFSAILLFVWLGDYYDKSQYSKYGKFEIGITTEFYVKRFFTYHVRYSYFVGDKTYSATYFTIKKELAESIVVPGGKYLIVYSERYPKNSLLIPSEEISFDFNLDSLNAVGVSDEWLETLDLW